MSDFGEGTRAAVAAGLALARRHGARLTLLHLLPFPSRSLLAEGVPREMLDWTHRQQREQRLAELATLAPAEPGLDIGRLVATGAPSTAIPAAATRLSVDLIVLGSRPRRRFLGENLSEVLVERAPCPVLIVRPGYEFKGEVGADHAGCVTAG